MRCNSLLVLLLLVSPVVSGEEAQQPSLALLEYLGEWQDQDGNEIDPQALALLGLQDKAGGGDSNDQE